jgi:MOSC domain-containing protein YiiM
VASAIRKSPLGGAVAVGVLGLDGDEQADLTVHGGQDKAVYVYPVEHYAFWETARSART